MMFANASNEMTKTQMYGLLAAAVSAYCPKYLEELYAHVGWAKIKLS